MKGLVIAAIVIPSAMITLNTVALLGAIIKLVNVIL